MNKSNPLLRIIAGAVGAVIGYLVVSQFLNGNAHFDKVLTNTANEMNKTLPMNVDSATRLDTTIGGPGKRFTYIYTLLTVGKTNVDLPLLQNNMRPQIIANYKTSDRMKVFRDQNVELNYEYKDKDGNVLFTIAVSPKDF